MFGRVKFETLSNIQVERPGEQVDKRTWSSKRDPGRIHKFGSLEVIDSI